MDEKLEVAKCAKDPIYFINNYCKIPHPRGLTLFKTFGYQDKLIGSVEANQFNIVLKARQLGISTLAAAYTLWLMNFKENEACAVLAAKMGTASNLVLKVSEMYSNLPEWLKISKVETDNGQEFKLDNASFIRVESPSSLIDHLLACHPLSMLVIDEAAYININGRNRSVIESLGPATKCLAFSTPPDSKNWFYEMYMGAVAGDNTFVPTKLTWRDHPEYNADWLKNVLHLSPEQVDQEYFCSFGENDTHNSIEILDG